MVSQLLASRYESSIDSQGRGGKKVKLKQKNIYKLERVGQLVAEEEYSDGDDQQEEEDEDNFPCPHCGALMSFEYLYFPDSGLLSGTCTKCGGAPAPRSPC